MKFFIPHTKNSKETEETYQKLVNRTKDYFHLDVIDNRIFGISYTHNSKSYNDQVGQYAYENELVIAILELDRMYVILTPHRGIFTDDFMMVSKEKVKSIELFES